MTTDLLDLARRTMGRTQGLDRSVAETAAEDVRSETHLRMDPPGEEPPRAGGGDLLAIARSIRAGDGTDTGCAKSAIRGKSPPASPLSAHLSLIAQPDEAATARLTAQAPRAT